MTSPMASDASDIELMGLMVADGPHAFDDLYDRYRERAYAMAWVVCRNRGWAEEAVQEGFLSVWRKRASYDETRGSVNTWLLTVVRRRALDLMRREGRHAVMWQHEDQLQSLPASDNVLRTVMAREDAHRLKASLLTLPEAQQEVISLAFYGQLTHAEIAIRLHLPSSTVKGRMRLGLHKLGEGLSSAPA